jgi:Arc/MetJ family transcription regulator
MHSPQRARQKNRRFGLTTPITARYIADGAPSEGIWVNVDDVLQDRGLEPIRRPGDRYSHGYRSEDRQAVGEHLSELERWAITGRLATWQGQRGTRRQPILIDSTLLAITDRVYQLTTEGHKVPLAIRCALGEYARHFLANGAGRQTALLMQAALRYDPYHEQTQKRLAYHLAFRWRLAAHSRDYDQPVSLATLFQEAHIPSDRPGQRRHPTRTIAGWLQALADLRRDGIIADYALLPGPDTAPKGKLEQWLAQRIRLTPPAPIPEHYQAIGARNPRLRQIP